MSLALARSKPLFSRLHSSRRHQLADMRFAHERTWCHARSFQGNASVAVKSGQDNIFSGASSQDGVANMG